jgi:hypothetical protein
MLFTLKGHTDDVLAVAVTSDYHQRPGQRFHQSGSVLLHIWNLSERSKGGKTSSSHLWP